MVAKITRNVDAAPFEGTEGIKYESSNVQCFKLQHENSFWFLSPKI